MKYDHVVKVNGKYYQAGQDVPSRAEKPVEKEPTVVAEKETPVADRKPTMKPSHKKD